MSKLPILPLVLGLVFAGVPAVFAQVGYTPGNAGNPTADFGATNTQGAGASAPSKPKDANADDDETDPSLQRLNTRDSLGGEGMSRDEGQLTAKMRRKEKVAEVDTKKLPTSRTDHKFDGNLLQSSVSSIGDLAEKPSADERANAEEGANPKTDVKDEEDPRFRTKHLLLNQTTPGESKKKDSPRTKADSSPSPSPSASASASPSSR